MKKIKLDQKIPTHLAFTIVIILSFLVAWLSIVTAEKIIKNAKQSSIFKMKGIQQELSTSKKNIKKIKK